MSLPGTTEAESLDLTARSPSVGHGARRALRGLAQVVLTLVIIGVLWVVFLKAAGLSPLVGRGPGDVWSYLVSGPGAAANLSSMLAGLGVTVGDAAIGFGCGLVAGVAVAVAFTLSRTLADTFLPVALLLRSVPFIAMTPVIVLVFGRGYLAVAVISGLVVFFPTLINVLFGLRSAPAGSVDLVHAYGGGPGKLMRHVNLPSCLPALFASARIGVPGAFIGALLAEWLDTGKGLGWRMLQDGTTFQYNDLWASVVVLTVACTLLYTGVGVLQSAVLARFGPEAGGGPVSGIPKVVASFACGRYDRTEPIQTGEVTPDGIDLVPMILHPADTFLRLTRDAEFDISEMSLSGHIMRTARGDDRYVGLPVFTSRAFRHRGIVLRREIDSIAGLAGGRVAVPEYHMTAALFMRGLLGDEFGFDPRSVTWVQAGQFTPGRIEREPPPRDVRVEVVTDKTIDEMLASGEVQAATTPYTSRLAGLPDSPIRPLFPDPLAAEADYLARTGIFPIMHLVVVRRTLVERHPWVAVNLVQALTKAKDLCLERMNGIGGHPPVALPFFLDSVATARRLLGDDLWPYGVEANRITLAAACRYSYEQGLSDRLLKPEELFAPATLLPGYLD